MSTPSFVSFFIPLILSMADDWDLQAVVRGCTTTTTTTTGAAVESDRFYSFSDQFEGEELDEFCKPFLPNSQNPPLMKPISSISSFCVSKPNPPPKKPPKKSPPGSVIAGCTTNSAGKFHAPRSKRRKNQVKKICQVPMEGLSSDIWSWRKYGQKPIKGSPYPRGYYRCSSSKGCLARKQVERNRSDPSMFTVTYTAEHNHPVPRHRNSLAGSTCQKALTPETGATEDQCGKTENRGDGKDLIEEDDNDEFGVSDMAVTDDFFEGLEEFVSPVTGECFSDHFPVSYSVPLVVNNAATAGGGG